MPGPARSTCVALLRAVNVGGRNAVAMADLRRFLSDLGLHEPRTLLQSGNAVFGSVEPARALEARLEAEAIARLSLGVDFLVRSAAEWASIVKDNPFPKQAKTDPGHLVVTVLKQAPTPAAVKALQAAVVGRETMRASGRHLYVVYPDGMGRSKLTHGLIEKSLGTRGTARNWNTVLKLAVLAGVAS